MDITKKQWIWVGAVFAGIVLSIVWILHYAITTGTMTTVSAPGLATSTNSEASSTSTSASAASTQAAAVKNVGPFPINLADNIVSWNFKGAYSDDAVLVAQANADIKKLAGLLGKGQYDDYDLYNGMANDYSNLGNGAEAYRNYNHAIAVHPEKGLAYTNLAHFMDALGAHFTSADAYSKAVAVEPNVLEYHIERLTYLTQQFQKDTARVAAAFADASKQFGDNASILSIEAKWLTAQGRYADAIKAWQTAKTLPPGKDTSAIDAEIVRLQAKQ